MALSGRIRSENVTPSAFVVTHFNRARDLRGAARITGAGPAEWGRVLISATVASRRTDPATQATTVLTELDVQGGEVPDQTIHVRRVVRALDPDDLDSSLEYRVDEPERADHTATTGHEPAGQTARQRIPKPRVTHPEQVLTGRAHRGPTCCLRAGHRHARGSVIPGSPC